VVGLVGRAEHVVLGSPVAHLGFGLERRVPATRAVLDLEERFPDVKRHA
jgi:hypothetical protein